jgi:protein-tyrosine-phosphatase
MRNRNASIVLVTHTNICRSFSAEKSSSQEPTNLREKV